jgi:Tol biopolymer transport system component
MRKSLNLTLLSCLLVALLPATAHAAAPQFEGASADGSIVFFTTNEPLVPGDNDSRIDIYERSYEPAAGEYVTRELSNGPAGGNDAVDALFEAISENGSKVFFQTTEPLVAADTDRSNDVYLRKVGAGSPELVTVGEADQNGAADASYVGSTPDGEEVFFVTAESLSPEDKDNADDIYERDLATGETHLVSAPVSGCATCEANAFPFFNGVSAGGQRVFFDTAGKLSPSDTDPAIDIYARTLPDGPTELVSSGNLGCSCGNDSTQDAVFAGNSADGSRVFFETAESLAAEDTDNGNDVYERAGGTTTLVSPGTEDKPANVARESGTFRPAISTDGSKVFFQTTEALPGDNDEANDVYEYSEGTVRLITPNTSCTGGGCGASFDALSPDGSVMAYTSEEQLVPEDKDSKPDIYVVSTSGGTPVLASSRSSSCSSTCGSNEFSAVFNRMSSDGSVVVFSSEEKLSPLDGDSDSDLFAHDLGTEETGIVSAPGLCPLAGGCDVGFAGASGNASRVFFMTAERLDPEDKDSELDLYERDRTAGVTRLVSRENEKVIGPSIPVLSGTNPTSPGASTTPAILGKSDPNTTIKLYLGAGCHGLPLQTQTPATGAQLEGAGIVVSVQAGTTTVFSASATDEEGVDSDCSASITYTQQDPTTPPPVEGGGESGGGGGESSTPTAGGSTGGGTSGGTHTGGGGSKGKPGVVYVTPLTRITFGPAAKTRLRRPVFRFADVTEQPGTAFFCKLDHKRWKPCASPLKLPRLGLGRHVLKVTAVNAVGVKTPAPVARKFKVVR